MRLGEGWHGPVHGLVGGAPQAGGQTTAGGGYIHSVASMECMVTREPRTRGGRGWGSSLEGGGVSGQSGYQQEAETVNTECQGGSRSGDWRQPLALWGTMGQKTGNVRGQVVGGVAGQPVGEGGRQITRVQHGRGEGGRSNRGAGGAGLDCHSRVRPQYSGGWLE